MSEDKFHAAKNNLSFSQTLVDKVRGQATSQDPHMAQPSPEMAQPQQTPQETPQDTVTTIQTALQPMFDDLKKTIQENEKQVELKIEGEMTPKEDPNV